MRKLLLVLVFLCGITLTGCVQLSSLTDEESNIMANYMADSLLKYDKTYKDALIDPTKLSTLEETSDSMEQSADGESADTESKAAAQGGTSGKTDNSQTASSSDESPGTSDTAGKGSTGAADLSKLMGNNKFQISCSGYKFYDSYPDDSSYFSLDTASGRKLLVMTFKIKNTTDKTQKLDLMDSGIEYVLEVDSGTKYNPKLTLMFNDLQYINMDISTGKTENAVLVFDVLDGTDMSEASLIITKDGESTALAMKGL